MGHSAVTVKVRLGLKSQILTLQVPDRQLSLMQAVHSPVDGVNQIVQHYVYYCSVHLSQ